MDSHLAASLFLQLPSRGGMISGTHGASQPVSLLSGLPQQAQLPSCWVQLLVIGGKIILQSRGWGMCSIHLVKKKKNNKDWVLG